MGQWITVNDKMQKNYIYELTCEEGSGFDSQFTPDLTPQKMLEMGIMGGKYMTDCQDEFPKEWFKKAKLSPLGKKAELNFFGVLAGKPLSYWKKKGWIYPDDPRGWFQWYCRYFRGRRLGLEDQRQIKRWRLMRRHLAQIRKNCEPGDYFCRPRQRQALLQWAYLCD
ncbi:hypothetical protein [Bartonella tamiae]|uniref:Uncharacterized protein n=1 Tax=Bartonella tamiae Th239 TaxID=1094558 RepID=J0QWS0_9HYPH|nr:hypothetical protein [Bartonella tamiae]EJF90456.1 hypothetical protein ME5_00857 [Bartonella tamiae Th239]EJF93600.1 hypothetical protein MEG_01024 [Bartonella tamiae Th307]